jgi:excisionase family DNA binding protein
LEQNEHRTNNPGLSPKASLGQVRRLLTLKEAAVVLGVSPATIRRLIWSGRLPALRLTRRIQVDTRDIDRLIERTKERSPR